MRRTVLVPFLVLVLVLGLATSAQAHRPIVFVHGFCPICNRSLTNGAWDTMVNRFQADGWPASKLVRFDYNTSQSNATSGSQLETYIDGVRSRFGVPKVDVVAHSMGSLVTRWCVKFDPCNVQDAALIAGPNHGTVLALSCALFLTPCKQMEQGSSFLHDLNAGDETPDQTDWATWRSPCDELVIPHSSASLDGAANHETECLGHVAMIFDGSVYRSIRDFVS